MDCFILSNERMNKNKEAAIIEGPEDVLNSKEWKDFFDRVKNDPDSLPPVCHRYCG